MPLAHASGAPLCRHPPRCQGFRKWAETGRIHYFKIATHENIRFSLLAVVRWDAYNHLG
jgi:hypothetical protein